MPMRGNAGCAGRGADAVEREPDAKTGMTTPMRGMVASMRGNADGGRGDADAAGRGINAINGDSTCASWCVGWLG